MFIVGQFGGVNHLSLVWAPVGSFRPKPIHFIPVSNPRSFEQDVFSFFFFFGAFWLRSCAFLFFCFFPFQVFFFFFNNFSENKLVPFKFWTMV